MNSTFFAPQLYIKNGITDVSFYIRAFGAIEHQRWTNDDGTIHVVELSIDGAIFHLHEVTADAAFFAPEKYNGTTILIGLFVDDVHAVMERAEAAGATITKPAQDHDYGYRQGELIDPFGHHWLIEKKIS